MMSRLVRSETARALRACIRARWGLGQPEGYGIAIAFDGTECSGSTYRTPRGLYSFDVRRKGGRCTILFSIHRPEAQEVQP